MHVLMETSSSLLVESLQSSLPSTGVEEEVGGALEEVGGALEEVGGALQELLEEEVGGVLEEVGGVIEEVALLSCSLF